MDTQAQPAAAASSPSTVTQANAVTQDATTAAGAVTTNSNQVSMSDTISSLAELKKKAPQVYHQMMLGIAMNICSDMQHHQDRLKEIMREDRDNG